MIKTIIFDLGKVIVPFELKRGLEAIQRHSRLSAEEIGKRLTADGIVARFEIGGMAPRQFVSSMTELLEMPVDYDTFCAAWCSIFLPDTLIPEEMIAALRRRYRTLLLSNTNAIHYQMLERSYPVLGLFDAAVLSHEVGAAKPSPAIYEAALAKAGCRPEECFYTDDIEEYVAAARRHGIDAVVFQSAGQVERELRARGVTW